MQNRQANVTYEGKYQAVITTDFWHAPCHRSLPILARISIHHEHLHRRALACAPCAVCVCVRERVGRLLEPKHSSRWRRMNWLVEIWWSTVLLVLLLLVRGSSCNMELLNWFKIPTKDLGEKQIGETRVFWLKEVVAGLPSHNVGGEEAMEVARLLRAAVEGSSAEEGVVWKTVTKDGLTFDIGLISLKTPPMKSMLFIMKPNDHSSSNYELLIEAIMMDATLPTPFCYATNKSHFLSYVIYKKGSPEPQHVDDKLRSLFTKGSR